MCEVLQEKRSFYPDNHGMLSRCRFDGAEGTKKSVFALMAWPSREGWLHGVAQKALRPASWRCARCVVRMRDWTTSAMVKLAREIAETTPAVRLLKNPRDRADAGADGTFVTRSFQQNSATWEMPACMTTREVK